MLPQYRKLSNRNITVMTAISSGYRVSPEGYVIAPDGTFRFDYEHDKRENKYRSVYIPEAGGWAYTHHLAGYQLFGPAAFLQGLQIAHLDGNGANSAHNNLVLANAAAIQRMIPPDRRKKIVEQIMQSRLNPPTSKQIKRVRKMLAAGNTSDEIGIAIGRTPSYVRSLKRRLIKRDFKQKVEDFFKS